MANLSIKGSKNNKRKYPGAKGKRPDLKKVRREECEERTKVWQSLSPVQQLKELDRKGYVAKKQHARLEALISKANGDVKTETEQQT